MLACYALIVSCVVTAGPQSSVDVDKLPPHPRLLFNRQGIDDFRKKVERSAWKKVWAKFLAEADKECEAALVIPPRGGNWSHNYVCPTHGSRLKQGKSIGQWQWEHRCPVGPHILYGDPSKGSLDFDGNAIMAVHGRYSQALRDLGLAYQVTGEKRYAERAKEILLAYAEKYRQFPRHDHQGKEVAKGGGRVASQPLTEASWLVPMAQGADLIWDALSPAEREVASVGLFRPAIDETILNNSTKPVIHNIQCHRNSAVALVGLLLGDAKLVAHAIDGPSGYRANMAKGVQSDGVWYEGAWGYHFFTLGGTWPLTEAARNCGVDLYGPEFKRLLDAPLQLAMPNFRLPAFNDSGEVDVAAEDDVYELGYARYAEPAYASLLAESKRASRMALWFGVDKIAAAAEGTGGGSRNAEASGNAILQQGDGRQATWLCLKYGPHGGGHGHYDKNHFVLYAHGAVVMPDSGTHAYGSSLHKGWDKTSFAHNTLVVNEKSQAEATGKCLRFGASEGVQFAMLDAGGIYPGVRFVRTALLAGRQTIVFIDRVQCERASTLDIVCHQRGRWGDVPAGNPFTPSNTPGYQYLRDASTRAGREGLALPLGTDGGLASRLVLVDREPTEVITGTGIGASTEDAVPTAVFRRSGQQTTFVWAVVLGSAEAQEAAKRPAKSTRSKRTSADTSGVSSARLESRSTGARTTVTIATNEGSWTVIADCGAGTVRVLRASER